MVVVDSETASPALEGLLVGVTEGLLDGTFDGFSNAAFVGINDGLNVFSVGVIVGIAEGLSDGILVGIVSVAICSICVIICGYVYLKRRCQKHVYQHKQTADAESMNGTGENQNKPHGPQSGVEFQRVVSYESVTAANPESPLSMSQAPIHTLTSTTAILESNLSHTHTTNGTDSNWNQNEQDHNSDGDDLFESGDLNNNKSITPGHQRNVTAGALPTLSDNGTSGALPESEQGESGDGEGEDDEMYEDPGIETVRPTKDTKNGIEMVNFTDK